MHIYSPNSGRTLPHHLSCSGSIAPRAVLLALLGLLSAGAIAVLLAQAAPPEIPGNPGVPGLLAQITAKDAQIAALQEQIATLEGDILALQEQITDKDAQIAALQEQIDDLEMQLAMLQDQSLVPQTGQTQCWDQFGNPLIACAGTGQDGEVQAGMALPSPRFTDHGNGTVTDHLTGLIWLQDASCTALGLSGNGAGSWQQALAAANTLADGQCSLTDSSAPGDWRLPNIKELQSLIHFGFSSPALSNAAGTAQWIDGDAFSGVQSTFYWSSTTSVGFPGFAWVVNLIGGGIVGNDKTSGTVFIWPVRDGP